MKARPTSRLPLARDEADHCGGDSGPLVRCRPRAEDELLAEGWQPRFIADARMAADAAEAYTELGYEVKMLPLEKDALAEVCGGCAVQIGQFRMIYTRRARSRS